MKLRAIALMITVLFAAVSLVSCSNSPTKEKIEITLMHGWGGSSPNHVNMRKIYKDFERANPDIKLTFDSSPDLAVVIDKANDKLAADKMPDIISTNGASQFLSNAIIRGKALNLKPYIDADEEFKRSIHPSIFKVWMTDNEIYTLPDALEIAGYWYNEDILQQAGVTEDSTSNSAVKLPLSWDEFWSACDKVKQWSLNRGQTIKPLMMENEQNMIFLGARIAGENINGTEFMSSSATNFNTDEFRRAIEDLRKANTYGDQPISRNDALQMFKDSEIAFFLSGVWDSDELNQSSNHDHINYAAFPAYDNKTVSYVSPSSGYVIGNTGDPQKIEACVRFLKYMLSDKVQKRLVVETKQAPSNPNVDYDWIKEAAPMLGMALGVANHADIQIRTLDSLSDEKAIDTLKNNLKRVINGSLSPSELSEMLSH
ncbi:ABC transporter substrate-binding protein [Paenibacillus segetis]|uniref:Carbohydrate ABC transporter substrate-binding protein, CUT1 family n=1 Tax=Paenibacillus segetis TaxID=1325360 RepID=A0ABQ1YLC9_9BACL|nr:extracellular solute-binding protein [Paenibacillus segetis]GGH29097.1 hypothetical protein GCM10008013_31490 [Paenibacillus segetis]